MCIIPAGKIITLQLRHVKNFFPPQPLPLAWQLLDKDSGTGVCLQNHDSIALKGLPDNVVRDKHAARNAILPVFTSLIIYLPFILGGGIITETIFSWPGIGKWLLEAVYRRDYPVIQGGVLLVAGLIILVNTLVDLLYVVINPRLRHQ